MGGSSQDSKVLTPDQGREESGDVFKEKDISLLSK